MKQRTFIIIIAAFVCCFAALGLWKRQSYTDITAEENYMDSMYVAELPTKNAVNDCALLETELPWSPVILRVTPEAEPECFFSGRQQLVSVLKVYSECGLSAGDEIYVTADSYDFYFDENAAAMGYVNTMKTGSDYLIFISGQVGSADDGTPVFRLQCGNLITAVFNCGECDNVVYPVSGGSSYVPYSEVKNNEFFAEEQEGLDAFLALKAKLLEQYA